MKNRTVIAALAVLVGIGALNVLTLGDSAVASTTTIPVKKIGSGSQTGYEVGIDFEDDRVLPVQPKESDAERVHHAKMRKFCDQTYGGRFTQSLEEMRYPKDEFNVSETSKPTKKRRLWDVMLSTCYEAPDGTLIPGMICKWIGWEVLPNVAGEIQRLRLQASSKLMLPEPPAWASLIIDDQGRSAALVNGATWFWTDPALYKPWSAKAEIDNDEFGHLWASVTATPIGLEFTPRPGEKPVKCQGPGEAFDPYVNNRAVDAPSGCFFRYRRTTSDDPGNVVTSSVGIRWRIDWQGSNGDKGTVAQFVTKTDRPLSVVEQHTLVTK